MDRSRRVDVRGILANPDLRRQLMIPTLQATQAREGIDTTAEQAERAYYVVTEGEKAAFFDLERFSGSPRQRDHRCEMFVRSLRGEDRSIRNDVARRDFGFIEGSLLVYRNIAWIAPIFRDHPPLSPTYGIARNGLNATEVERFTRQRWEVDSPQVSHRWVLFAKGGGYSRFYTDWDLVIDWTDHGAEFKDLVKLKYGSATRFVKSESDYFREGVTWMQTTILGMNARRLPATGVFGVASPTFFPTESQDIDAFLALMNCALFDALARCVATRNWGGTAIGSIPVPRLAAHYKERLANIAKGIHDAKAAWDAGNEVSAAFRAPWLLMEDHGGHGSIANRLAHLTVKERSLENECRQRYSELNDEVYKLYGIPAATRAMIEEQFGNRPREVIWPEMVGKTPEQKRMEHVFRLLSYVVKRVVEADEDGIVPFAPVAGEPSLVDRVQRELQALFPELDVGHVEAELANELKTKAKGYRRFTGIAAWLESAFFSFHCSLYKNRPIFWHIASSQGASPFAFGAVVHYHRFDKKRMAQLRAQYVRDAMETFRREAALADKAGRVDDRQEWQGRLEEARELDVRLQRVQEGYRDGPGGGKGDYRILTPWKAGEERPHGWDPDLDDGVKVNIEALQRAGVLRVAKVV